MIHRVTEYRRLPDNARILHFEPHEDPFDPDGGYKAEITARCNHGSQLITAVKLVALEADDVSSAFAELDANLEAHRKTIVEEVLAQLRAQQRRVVLPPVRQNR